MDKTFFVIIIPQIVALLIVGLTFLFNHLNKNREFKHNEHWKKLELEQREKERKFKVEEKMIERSIEAHIEAFGRVIEIFGIVNWFYGANGTLKMPEEREKHLRNLFRQLQEWNNSKGLFLEKTIQKQIGFVTNIAPLALAGSPRTKKEKLDIWTQLYRTIEGLLKALEMVFKEYNPLYDMNIKLPEIEAD